jgi:hypothetical protein
VGFLFTEQRKPGMCVSSQQSRGARGLLQWKLADLAEASGLGLSTVKHFEVSQRKKTPEIAIRRAFEKAGIVFESGSKFVGVRLNIKQVRIGRH